MYIKKQKNIKKTRYRQKPLDLKNAEGLEKHTQSVVLSIGKSAPVAQGIERRFPKPCVGGSNPLGSARMFLFELLLLQMWISDCSMVRFRKD